MPTKFTRSAGTIAMLAAGLWLAAAALFLVGQQFIDDWNTSVYLIWSAGVIVAGVLTFVVGLGLRQRMEKPSVLATVGLVLLGLGVVISLLSWAIPAWMMFQGLGMLLLVLAIWPSGLAPKPSAAAYGLGMLAGTLTFLALTFLEVGTPDQYGDYPIAWETGLAVGCVVTAAGLFGLGSWLRGEAPEEIMAGDRALTS